MWPPNRKLPFEFFIFESQNGVSRISHCARKRRLRRAPIKIILIEEICKRFESSQLPPSPYLPQPATNTRTLASITYTGISLLWPKSKKNCSSRYGKQTKNIKMSSDLHLFHFQLISLFDTRVLYFFKERKVASDDISFNSSSLFFLFLSSPVKPNHRIQFFFPEFQNKKYTQVPLRCIICTLAGALALTQTRFHSTGEVWWENRRLLRRKRRVHVTERDLPI